MKQNSLGLGNSTKRTCKRAFLADMEKRGAVAVELHFARPCGPVRRCRWFVSPANQIEEFRLSDGSKVLASEVQSLLSAMAVFSAPPAAMTAHGHMADYQVRHYHHLTMPALM